MDSQSLHKVGFIGLGNMGNPMARNLIESGFNLVVHDLRLAFGRKLADDRGKLGGFASGSCRPDRHSDYHATEPGCGRDSCAG